MTAINAIIARLQVCVCVWIYAYAYVWPRAHVQLQHGLASTGETTHAT